MDLWIHCTKSYSKLCNTARISLCLQGAQAKVIGTMHAIEAQAEAELCPQLRCKKLSELCLISTRGRPPPPARCGAATHCGFELEPFRPTYRR